MDPGRHGHERLPAGDVRRLPALQRLPEPVPVTIRLGCSNQAIEPIIYPPPVSDNVAVATLKCKTAIATRRREFLSSSASSAFRSSVAYLGHCFYLSKG